MIKVYVLENNQYVLHEKSCLIGTKLHLATYMASPPRVKESIEQCHYFGNNAFTVHQTNVKEGLYPNDKRYLATFIAGLITGQMMNISSYDKHKKEAAVCFFKDLYADTPHQIKTDDLLPKSSIVESIRQKLYKAHCANANAQGINATDEAGFQKNINPIDIPEKSFLASQQLKEISHAVDGQVPRCKKFTVAFTFSAIVLSPHTNNSVNAVFINTLYPKNSTDPHKSHPTAPKGTPCILINNTQLPRSESRPSSSRSVGRTSAWNSKLDYRSTLPPELELELELI